MQDKFLRIAEELLSNPDVTSPLNEPLPKKGFGSSGLKIHNKIFAMLVKDKLVVKLPKLRVDELIADGYGERFDPHRDGRLMKEWIVLEPTFQEEWLSLAKEAMEFVASQR